MSKDFLTHARRNPDYRKDRVRDFRDVEIRPGIDVVREQAKRCMGCGIPFCHAYGCPLGNNIPEINAAVADALGDIADELEAMLAAGQSLNTALQELLPRLFREHMPVVFNGNGYGDAWPVEAARRGLPNYRGTVEALEHYNDPEVKNLFVRQGILSEREVEARCSILLENYAKTVIIEGRTLADILRSRVIPEGARAQKEAAALANATQEALGDAAAERAALEGLRRHMLALRAATDNLEKALAEARRADDDMTAARRARDMVIPAMQACRVEADALERLVDDAEWSLPKYQELLWIH